MRKIIILVFSILISTTIANAENIQIDSFNIKYLEDGLND